MKAVELEIGFDVEISDSDRFYRVDGDFEDYRFEPLPEKAQLVRINGALYTNIVFVEHEMRLDDDSDKTTYGWTYFIVSPEALRAELLDHSDPRFAYEFESEVGFCIEDWELVPAVYHGRWNQWGYNRWVRAYQHQIINQLEAA